MERFYAAEAAYVAAGGFGKAGYDEVAAHLDPEGVLHQAPGLPFTGTPTCAPTGRPVTAPFEPGPRPQSPADDEADDEAAYGRRAGTPSRADPERVPAPR